jgi:hypothetical protein
MEGLVALIDRYRLDALDFLDGSFVIAVEDARDGLWCATDHSATIPLYYKFEDGNLDVTTRAENVRIKKVADIDLAGLISCLNTGYPWGSLFLHNAWKVLRPGQVLKRAPGGEFSIEDYFLGEEDEEVQGFTTPEELWNEIQRSVAALASRYKKLLIPLSGGIDSRLITLACYRQGIPFEAITFVANVPDGDDFDIASRLVKIYGVKHHRWEWSPADDAINNFSSLCMATGGTNDAYTTYPDAMKKFAKVAAGFDCILRGDHSFGFGSRSDSLFQSANGMCMNFKDDLNWALRPEYQGRVDVESVFEEQEQVSRQLKGSGVDPWRHRSRRLTRNPRAHLPIGQLQAQHTMIGYPLLSRSIVSRMARSDVRMRNDKQIAIDALAFASPPDILRIPHSSRHTWAAGEPLLDLPQEVLMEMAQIIRKPGILSEIVDEQGVVEMFWASLSSGKAPSRPPLKSVVKSALKKLLPTRINHKYRDVNWPRTPVHMLFKRLFAAKVFIDGTD